MKANLTIEPLGLRPPEAAAFCGGMSMDMLERCRAVGWIKPAVSVHGFTSYEIADLKLLWRRIKKEGFPPKRSENPAPCLVSPGGV